MSRVGPRGSVKVQNPGSGSSRQCHLSLHGYGGGKCRWYVKFEEEWNGERERERERETETEKELTNISNTFIVK